MAKDNRKNNRYSEEFKVSILKRLEQPTTDTVKSISDELGIPRPTIIKIITIDLIQSQQLSILC